MSAPEPISYYMEGEPDGSWVIQVPSGGGNFLPIGSFSPDLMQSGRIWNKFHPHPDIANRIREGQLRTIANQRKFTIPEGLFPPPATVASNSNKEGSSK